MAATQKGRKRRLFTMMEITIILAILVSTAAIIFGDYHMMALGIFPAALLIKVFAEFREEYPKEFTEYAVLFGFLFIICLAGPFAFRLLNISSTGSVFKSLSYLLYALAGVVILFVVFKVYFVRKYVVGKVTLADSEKAVVEVECDLLAGVRDGEYAVRNKGAKKGQTVRVSLRRRFFGPPVPDKVLGVVRS